MKKIISLIVFVSFLLLDGCGNNNNNTEENGPTFGKVTIAVDETFKPVFESEVATFNSIYNQAHINVLYLPESEAVDSMLAGKAALAIVCRKLNSQENKYFEKIKIVPYTAKVAYDGVAVILNPAAKESTFTIQQLKDILSGSGKNNYKIIFDNKNSSTVRVMRELTGADTLSAGAYAVKSNEAVVDYVSKEKNTIGFIGVNWISDSRDTVSNSFLKKIKVASIAGGDGEFYEPYQAYIAQKLYPLKREIYTISREARSGLGSGFIAFLSGEKGQRIFLKSGLVPATMPVRIVEVKQRNFNIQNDKAK